MYHSRKEQLKTNRQVKHKNLKDTHRNEWWDQHIKGSIEVELKKLGVGSS